MLQSRPFTALVLAFFLLGCTAKQATGPAPNSPKQSERIPKAFSELAQRVALARELPQKKPTPLEFHDEASFMRAVRESARRTGLPPTVVDHPAFQLAFGLAVIAEKSSPPFAVTQHQQTQAFYDPVGHKIHARRPTSDRTEEAQRLVIAHELAHSLQHQYFKLPDYRRIDNEDERMAQLALLEGDAMLTMLAYISRERHAPLSRTLVQMRKHFRGSIAAYESASGVDSKREQLPALTRERLMFPYSSGLYFVGELYRAGGYDLVNRVYEKPPTTTEQILHPDRYLAGEGAATVPTPGLPKGHVTVASGSVGQLWTKVTLGVCVDPDIAARAAEGWGGDAFRITRTPDDLGALIWITSWDTTKDAREFESAARRLAKCWEHAQLTARSVFAAPPLVQRKRERVAVVRGLAPAVARKQARAALRLPVTKPESHQPFGNIELRKVADAKPLAPARVSRGKLIAPRAGFVAPVPKGFKVDLEDNIILYKGTPARLQITIAVSDQQVSDESLQELYAALTAEVKETLSWSLVLKAKRKSVQTPLGPGILRRWAVKSDREAKVALLVVPLCDNTGALLISQIGLDDASWSEIGSWLETVEAIPKSDGDLCGFLNP